MTPEEIRRKREEIQKRIAGLELEIKKEKIGFSYLVLECTHPKAYTYDIMGRDTGWTCPDCGLSK